MDIPGPSLSWLPWLTQGPAWSCPNTPFDVLTPPSNSQASPFPVCWVTPLSQARGQEGQGWADKHFLPGAAWKQVAAQTGAHSRPWLGAPRCGPPLLLGSPRCGLLVPSWEKVGGVHLGLHAPGP